MKLLEDERRRLEEEVGVSVTLRRATDFFVLEKEKGPREAASRRVEARRAAGSRNREDRATANS